ncbi:MAG TPA: hypothetical protein P5150_00295 [Candidatus Ratteibacteria bacterium]|nr:hypothetical protein [Candidatus Ratteibacteria bacterium]
MKLKEIKCIWWDGYHNAFTDIIKYKESYFVCFRHATEHGLKGQGEIYVLKSNNLENWELITKFPPLKDSRDPKFFIFEEKLGVLFFAYPDINTTQIRDGYISYSDDGENFSPVIKISKDNLCFWRIRNYKEKLYATAYKGGEKEENWGSYLFVSDDGENFNKVSTILEGEYANETDLLFEGDICYAIVRRENLQTPALCISKYPFDKWESYNLNKIIQGPCIFKFKGEIYIAGRVNTLTKTGILKLDLERKRVKDEIILPSEGDTSYCGVVVENNKFYLSYYSQHEIEKRESKVGENAAGIYIAEIGE